MASITKKYVSVNSVNNVVQDEMQFNSGDLKI